METARTTTLLQSVKTLRDLFEQEQEPADKEDLLVAMLLDTFIRDQEYSLGLIPVSIP